MEFHANSYNISGKTIYVTVKQEKLTPKLYLTYFYKKSGKEIKEIKDSIKEEINSLIKQVEKRAEKDHLIIWSY